MHNKYISPSIYLKLCTIIKLYSKLFFPLGQVIRVYFSWPDKRTIIATDFIFINENDIISLAYLNTLQTEYIEESYSREKRQTA